LKAIAVQAWPGQSDSPADSSAPGAPDRPRSPAAIAGLAAVLLIAGAAATALDWPAMLAGLHAWLDARDLRPVCKIVCLADVFSDGLGVAAILLLAATLDPARRRAVVRIAAMTFAAGALCDGVNAVLLGWGGRPLERSLFWLAAFAGQLPDDTAHRAAVLLSSHAAVATALALGLAEPYRRGRVLFGAFAALAIAERLLFRHEGPSGALAGAAMGCAVCAGFSALTGLIETASSVRSS
jgi:hypothetical protein